MSDEDYEIEEEEEVEEIDLAPQTGETVDLLNQYSQRKYSASLLEDYHTCGLKAYARITKQPRFAGVSLVLGSAVHTSIEELIVNEKDPISSFRDAFAFNAEKNELLLSSDEEEKNLLLGEKLVTTANTILEHKGMDGVPFINKIDRNLVERKFVIERKGVLYTGKMDLIHVTQGGYFIADWKTGKRVPKQFQLDGKIQFTMYAEAAATDKELPTFGNYPLREVWVHLRGKNIAKDANGKAVRKESQKIYQYDFPTIRTPEIIERHFQDTIEPTVRQIESGVFTKIEGEHCQWCSYFDKARQRCNAEMPKEK